MNGVKKFITGGQCVGYFSTIVRTGKAGHRGLSMLVIPASAPGVTVTKLKAAGWWAGDAWVRLGVALFWMLIWGGVAHSRSEVGSTLNSLTRGRHKIGKAERTSNIGVVSAAAWAIVRVSGSDSGEEGLFSRSRDHPPDRPGTSSTRPPRETPRQNNLLSSRSNPWAHTCA